MQNMEMCICKQCIYAMRIMWAKYRNFIINKYLAIELLSLETLNIVSIFIQKLVTQNMSNSLTIAYIQVCTAQKSLFCIFPIFILRDIIFLKFERIFFLPLNQISMK